eukprot:8960546-Pyramimonas_sp.AAC.1
MNLIAERIASIVKLPDAAVASNMKALFPVRGNFDFQQLPREFCEAYSVILNYPEWDDMEERQEFLTAALAVIGEDHMPSKDNQGTIIGSTLRSFRKANQFVLNAEAHSKKITVTQNATAPFVAKVKKAEALANAIGEAFAGNDTSATNNFLAFIKDVVAEHGRAFSDSVA